MDEMVWASVIMIASDHYSSIIPNVPLRDEPVRLILFSAFYCANLSFKSPLCQCALFCNLLNCDLRICLNTCDDLLRALSRTAISMPMHSSSKEAPFPIIHEVNRGPFFQCTLYS